MNIERTDLIVVGAGPAGLSAAIEAARSGVSVLVVDETEKPGGQIYRQLPDGFNVTNPRALGKEYKEGQALLREMARHPIRFVGGTLTWGCFEPGVLECMTGNRAWRAQGQSIVIAPGAYDRPAPVPGWTLPGVLTVGGTQTLLKTQRVLPGRRILLAGTGPLLLVVASQLTKAGAHVVAVAEAVPTRKLFRYAGVLASSWSTTRLGMGYRWNLLKARVPWIAPAIIVRIEGAREVQRATIASVDQEWRTIPGTDQSFDVDAVCLGYGLIPSVELLRLCGCALVHDPLADAWVPKRNQEFETTVPGIYAVGDGAGVAGALVAAEEGRIAGIAVARALGRLSPTEASAQGVPARARLARLARLRAALDDVYRFRRGLYDVATPDTVVCRCEEVCLRDLTRAIADGATTLNQVKAWTRIGMGACQGRMCSIPTAHVVANALGCSIEALGYCTPRPPVKPIGVTALIAEMAEVDAGMISGQGGHPW
jgi:thioredoxin reductase/bacterioferritin-associated ferredoxin